MGEVTQVPCRAAGRRPANRLAQMAEETPPTREQRPGLMEIAQARGNAALDRDYLMRMFMNPCVVGEQRWRREISWVLLWGRSRATGYEAVSLPQERLVARSRARARARMRSLLRELERNLPQS